MAGRWMAAILGAALAVSGAAASADALDMFKPLWLQALEGRQEEAEAPELPLTEPEVVCRDVDLEVVRASVHMNQDYSAEAYVYVELKNVGDSVIRADSAEITVYGGREQRLGKEDYVACAPDAVAPGESLYISEWMYDFVGDAHDVSRMDISVGRREYSRKRVSGRVNSRAYAKDDRMMIEITNDSAEPVRNVEVVAAALNRDGEFVELLFQETPFNMAIAPGSTVIFDQSFKDHALDALDAGQMTFETSGYVYTER